MNYGVQAPPNPWAVLDREIAWYTRRKYQVVGRTETTAQLFKKKRYNYLIALALFLTVGGVVFYSLYHLLVKRDKMVYLEVDPYGQVRRIERPAGKRKRSEVVVGVLLLALVLLFIAVIVLLAVVEGGQLRGVHACRPANYNDSGGSCLLDDTSFTLGDLQTGRLVIGSSGSGGLPDMLEVSIRAENAAGLYVQAGESTLFAGGLQRMHDTLGDIFAAARVQPATGHYQIEVDAGPGGASIGTYSFAITP